MSDDRLALQTAIAPVAWGTTYIALSELLPPDRPLLAALGRALPAGLLLAALFRGLPRGEWWWKAPLLGLLNVGGFFALLLFSADRLPGGVTATFGAVGPLVVAGLAWALLGTRPTLRILAAGLAGVIGVGLLVLTASAALDPLGVAAGVGATLSASTGIVLTRRFGPPPQGALVSAGWQLVAASVFLLPLTLALEGTPATPSGSELAGFAYLALVTTALPYAFWFRGIAVLAPTRVAFLTLLSPAVATIIGWAALGQGLTPLQAFGMAIALGSVVAGQGALPRPNVRLRVPRRGLPALSERAAPAPSRP